MKKTFYILVSTIILASCSDASIKDAVTVEQVNIYNVEGYKYEVKLKSSVNDVFYYTNERFQVGDTLYSYYQYFEGKGTESRTLKLTIDSLRNELKITKYYLEILKERVIFDTIKKR